MLEFIRKHSNSIIVKIFLTILAGSFFLFFGFSYIVDRIKGRDYIVKIANIKISPQLFKIEKTKKLEMLRRMSSDKLDDKNLSSTILHQLIWENIIDLASKDFGIIVSDSTMYSYISNLEVFRTEDGHFSAANLRNFLQKIQVPESLFLESEKREIKSHILKTPFKFVSIMDEFDMFVNAEFEHRSLNVIKLNPSSIKIKQIPSKEDLEAFYAENSEQFMTPEKRSFRILQFEEADIEKNIKISDEEVKDAYEFSDQKDERSFEDMKSELLAELKQERLNAAIEELTRKIEDLLVSGNSVEETATAHNLKIITVKDAKLNDINKINLPYANDILTVAFSTDEKEISTFTESLGNNKKIVQWLVYIDNIKPKHVEQFSSVEGKVKDAWLKSQQYSASIDKANQIIEAYKAENVEGIKKIISSKEISKTSLFNREKEIFTKDEAYKQLIQNVCDEAFNMSKSDIFYKEIDGVVYVYYLKDIVHDKEVIEKNKQLGFSRLISANTEDLYQQLVGYLSKKYEVKINNEMLKEMDDYGEAKNSEVEDIF